jgi:hypothetical protein
MATHNTGSGDWHSGSTWNPPNIPNNNTDVVLDRAGTVTLKGGASADRLAIEGGNVSLVMTDATLSVDTYTNINSGNLRAQGGTNTVGTIISRGSLFVDGGATLKIGQYASYDGNVAIADGGTLQARVTNNYGTIGLSSTSNLTTLKLTGRLTTELNINSKNYRYTGGQVTLSDSAENLIEGSFGNVNNVISGAGTIRGDIVTFAAVGVGTETGDHSAGFIRATGTDNQLILDLVGETSGFALKNGGVIDTASKAGLVIRTADGSVERARVQNTGVIAAYASRIALENVDVSNAGGTIKAAATTALLVLQDTKIAGGTLSSVADTRVVAIGSDSVTDASFALGGDLQVVEDASLKVSGGTFSVGGNLTVAGKLFFDGALTLQTGATATIDGVLSGAGATLNNVNERLTGTGTVKVGTLSNQSAGKIDGSLKLDITSDLTNQGSIVGATVDAKKVVNAGTMSDGIVKADTVTNSGTMSGVTFRTPYVFGVPSVINQKTGVINASSFGKTVVANLGLIEADGAGKVLVLDGTEIRDGTLSSSNGGVIKILGKADFHSFVDVDKIAAGTAFAIANGATLALNNSNGPSMALDKASISVGATNETTQLSFLGSFTLQGAGKITLSDSALNSVSAARFTNVDGTISGGGEITVDVLDNQAGGTIEANGDNDLTLEFDPGDRFTNNGRLEADGGTLRVVTPSAILGAGEVLVTNDGTVDLSDARQFLGSLSYVGRGTILGPDLVPAGTISGFATGDSYVFGQPTTLSGSFSTIWQENAGHTGGTLTIKGPNNQTYAALQLAGDYLSSDFAASLDAMPDGNHVAVNFIGALKWSKPVSGSWQTASNWGPTGLFVPGPDDNALIAASGARYTVTSAQDTTVKSVSTGADATLLIKSGTFTTTTGRPGTFNAGMVRIDDGASFVVGGIFAQESTGGIVADGTGATVDIAKGGSISGGRLALANGAALKADNGSAALDDVVVVNHAAIGVANKTTLTLVDSRVVGDGSLAVGQGSTLALANSGIRDTAIDLAGTMQIDTNVSLSSPVALSGGRILSGGSAVTLLNGGAIRGSGTIGDGNLSLINYGTITTGSVGTAGKITIGSKAIVNRGNIFALAGGSLHVSGALANAVGLFAQGGSAEFTGEVANSGLMQAKGANSSLTFKGSLTNAGVVAATEGQSSIDVHGTITQKADGELLASGRKATLDFRAGSRVSGGTIGVSDDAILSATHGGEVTLDHATLSIDETSNLVVLGTTLALDHTAVQAERLTRVSVSGRNGILALDDSTLDGGNYRVFDGATVRVAGSSVLEKFVAMNLDDEGSKIVSNGKPATLTNAGNLSGKGTIGDENLTLVNGATGNISVSPFVTMTIDTGANTVVNNGTMGAIVGATLSIGSSLVNSSTGKVRSGLGTVTTLRVDNAGLIDANGGLITVHGGLVNSGQVQATAGGTLKSLATVNSGKAFAIGAGSVLSLGDTSSVATNTGTISASSGGTVTFGNGVSNAGGGQIEAQEGSHVQVFGAATGGIARITGDGAVMDFEGSTDVDTTTSTQFGKQGLGQLVLNHSSHFAGTVAGLAAGDTIDVKDVAFVAGKDSFDAATGVLTVSDGAHTAKIQLLGQYMAADFAFASDGHGGTLVTGTPTADPAPAIASLFAAHA